MGRTQAIGFAEAVDDGLIDLRGAVHYHLLHNHYPPHPAFMVPVAVAAVEAGQDEEWDQDIVLPRVCADHPEAGFIYTLEHDDHAGIDHAVQWRNREDGLARAGDIIESFHLDSFLLSFDEEDDDVEPEPEDMSGGSGGSDNR